MITYKIDIGCFDCGDQLVVKAKDLHEAFLKVGKRIDKESKHCKSGEEPYVVQVFQGSNVVWDFINGRLR